MRTERGFTLIELLVVLAILGILAGIAIPAFLGHRERARARAVQDMVNTAMVEVSNAVNTLSLSTTSTNADSMTLTSIIAKVASINVLKDAHNPYGGKVNPFLFNASAKNIGEVGIQGNSSFKDPITGAPGRVITIRGLYKDDNQKVSCVKVIAID